MRADPIFSHFEYFKKAWILLGAALILLACESGAEKLSGRDITVSTAVGDIHFLAEVAATPKARQQGLMRRTALAENAGMLFVFDKTEPVSFWMKDTPLTLDMIFISEDKHILYIEHQTVPFSTQIISSQLPVRFVLEVIGGSCQKKGIAVGDRVLFQ